MATGGNFGSNVPQGAGNWSTGTVVRDIEGHFNRENEPKNAQAIDHAGGVPGVDFKDRVKDAVSGGHHGSSTSGISSQSNVPVGTGPTGGETGALDSVRSGHGLRGDGTLGGSGTHNAPTGGDAGLSGAGSGSGLTGGSHSGSNVIGGSSGVTAARDESLIGKSSNGNTGSKTGGIQQELANKAGQATSSHKTGTATGAGVGAGSTGAHDPTHTGVTGGNIGTNTNTSNKAVGVDSHGNTDSNRDAEHKEGFMDKVKHAIKGDGH